VCVCVCVCVCVFERDREGERERERGREGERERGGGAHACVCVGWIWAGVRAAIVLVGELESKSSKERRVVGRARVNFTLAIANRFASASMTTQRDATAKSVIII
jgi:hypothetical protein